jgi:hypothetical protein
VESENFKNMVDKDSKIDPFSVDSYNRSATCGN